VGNDVARICWPGLRVPAIASRDRKSARTHGRWRLRLIAAPRRYFAAFVGTKKPIIVVTFHRYCVRVTLNGGCDAEFFLLSTPG
jgi:hypothetical protein